MAVENSSFIHQNAARGKSGQCRVQPEMSPHHSSESEGANRVLRLGSWGSAGWCGRAQSVLKRPIDGRPRWRSRGILPPLGVVESCTCLVLAFGDSQLRKLAVRLVNYMDDSKSWPFAADRFAQTQRHVRCYSRRSLRLLINRLLMRDLFYTKQV